MPQIPRVSQVPIIEPMYANGVLNTVWVRFFEKLASMLNTGDLADLLTLLQLANQLPSQSLLGQISMDIPVAQFDMVAVPPIQTESMPAVPTFLPQATPFDMVAVPTSEIIKP